MASSTPADPPRLSAGSETTLARSLATIHADEPAWISMDDARRLFSRADAQYAFGETDDEGRAMMDEFARRNGVHYDIMPVEGRVYFRKGPR